MSNAGRIVMFLAIVLFTWSLMHAYVLARLWSLPLLSAPGTRRWLVVAFITLWVSFPLAQIVARTALGRLALPLEVASAIWLGTLFLLFVWLLAADAATGFGWLLPGAAVRARSVAVAIALTLAVVALVQGLRPPVVRSHDVPIKGLPAKHEGFVIVQITDLHLGQLLGRRWLETLISRIDAVHPDVVFVTGDLLNEVNLVEPLVPVLRRVSAPRGVYAVTGNHEFYAGVGASVRLFSNSGFRVLRNEAAEIAPGLVVAGVDDLTAGRQFSMPGNAIERALTGRPPGATILLSHSPWGGDQAARLGVGLMLSGHTHGGQIWPFSYVTRLAYPYVVGRYAVGDMTWIVSRGTGFWGPPMRLFRRAELLKITLRSQGPQT